MSVLGTHEEQIEFIAPATARDDFSIDITAPVRPQPKAVYRHPDFPDLTWTGRGRRPQWVDDILTEPDVTMDSLRIEQPQERPATSAVTGELVEENSNVRHGGHLEKKSYELTEEDSNRRHGGDLEEGTKNLAVELGINLSDSVHDLIHDAAIDMGKAATILVRSGLRLIAAKEKCEHGAFESHCESIGIPRQRAAEAMRYATFAAQLPANQRSKYLMLPRKSAFLLGNADPEVVEFLLDDEHIDQTRKLRTKTELSELARALTETEDALERHRKENAQLHEENRRLREAQEAHIAGSEYPLHVVKLRKESSVLTDEAIACISSIDSLAAEFMRHTATDDSSAADRNFDAGMMPALANLASIARSANALLIQLTQEMQLELDDITGGAVRFSASELEVIAAAREAMLARKDGKAANREGQYAADGQLRRGRGRPKKG